MGAAARLLIFGLGYSGCAVARAAMATGAAVAGTSRTPGRGGFPAGVEIVDFAAAERAVGQATHLLSTAAPEPEGDPVLARYGAAIARADRLRWLGYLSTTGVYGDRGGGWIDEDTRPAPSSERGLRRIAAEDAWRDAAGTRPLDIFRVAGIYGPGRSAIDDLRAGRARRVVKPGHVFSRVHRDDIARGVLAAMRSPSRGARILHLGDDEPAAAAEVIAEAARLLGVAAPEPVEYAAALPAMSEMARSFWRENRKVSSRKTREWLAMEWLYPTYREGLAAILREQSGEGGTKQSEVGGA